MNHDPAFSPSNKVLQPTRSGVGSIYHAPCVAAELGCYVANPNARESTEVSAAAFGRESNEVTAIVFFQVDYPNSTSTLISRGTKIVW